MPMRIALAFYLILLALLAVNVVYVTGWPLWTAVVPIAVASGAVAVSARQDAGTGHPSMLFECLLLLGTIGLAAAAIALAMPAWQVIDTGASAAGAGLMAPTFVAALALYGANLWLDTALASGGRDALERIARLLSGPRLLPSFVAAVMLTAGFVLALDWSAESAEGARTVTRRFLERGVIPPATVLLFFFGLLLLAGKCWNGWFLARALRRWRSEVGTGEKAERVSGARWEAEDEAGAEDEPRTRTGPGLDTVARSESGGGGATAPIVAALHAVAGEGGRLEESLQLLWRRYEESYLLPRYIGWAVPILGFIGTVLGISLAADGIRRIISSDAGLSSLSSDLGGAIAPLGIAFDTTLIALSLSVVLTLLLSLVQRTEERTLAVLEWEVREASRAR